MQEQGRVVVGMWTSGWGPFDCRYIRVCHLIPDNNLTWSMTEQDMSSLYVRGVTSIYLRLPTTAQQGSEQTARCLRAPAPRISCVYNSPVRS